MKYNEIMEKLDGVNTRSAWEKGVLSYAYDLIENVLEGVMCEYFIPFEVEITEYIVAKYCYNGKRNAIKYSYTEGALIYDRDFVCGLCAQNNSENWLDVQARALSQAAELLVNIVKGEVI